MNARVIFKIGDRVKVTDQLTSGNKNYSPAISRDLAEGVVVSVEDKGFYQNVKVRHPNGVWGWISTEIELLEEQKDERETI
jgi:hypothetical protein